MSLLTATRIAELVGEMEAPACEHQQHRTPGCAHDEGPATHYGQGICPFCGYLGSVKPLCAAFVALVLSNRRMACGLCGAKGFASEFNRILGPVNK